MENTGVSFGLMVPYVEVVMVLALLLVSYAWWRGREWGWWLLIAGGFLNLVERLVNGSVRDYWPIIGTNIYNNLNDYLIFAGVILVIIQKWKKSK